MRIIKICAPLFIAVLLAGRLAAQTSLEDEVKKELAVGCFDGPGCTPVEERVLKLAPVSEISRVLMDLTAQNLDAQRGQSAYSYLVKSVSILGSIHQTRAIPVLIKVAKSSERSVRVSAIQAIGEIDPAGSRDLLLEALKDPYGPIRYAAAAGLSRLDDPLVLSELEIQASRELSREAFLSMQAKADSMRARINAKSKVQ